MLTEPETHQGMLVSCGRLMRRTHRRGEAIIRIPCPLCGWHEHGWQLSDGKNVLTYRASHCEHIEPGYFIGLDATAAHAVPIKQQRRSRVLKE